MYVIIFLRYITDSSLCVERIHVSGQVCGKKGIVKESGRNIGAYSDLSYVDLAQNDCYWCKW
jgi:hypothetical protein